MSVTANITVSFGDRATDGANGHLSAEIDGRPEGLNQGKTSFSPGDRAHFLVYKSANVTYSRPVESAGTITQGTAGLVVTKEADLQFPDTDTATLGVPALSIESVTWMGRSLGALTLTDPQTVKASAKGVAVARVRYRAIYASHRE